MTKAIATENVKKALALLLSKTTTLHGNHTFFYISVLPITARLRRENVY